MDTAKLVYATYLAAYLWGCPDKGGSETDAHAAASGGLMDLWVAAALGVTHRESCLTGPLSGRELVELVAKMRDVG